VPVQGAMLGVGLATPPSPHSGPVVPGTTSVGVGIVSKLLVVLSSFRNADLNVLHAREGLMLCAEGCRLFFTAIKLG
jgi:hypothetical protein